MGKIIVEEEGWHTCHIKVNYIHFEEFLRSGGVGIKSLDLLVGDEEYDSSFENQSVKRRKGGGKMGNNDTHKEYVGSLILVEEVSF